MISTRLWTRAMVTDGSAAPVVLTVIAPIVELVDGIATREETHLSTHPDWSYDAVWSGQSPADQRESELAHEESR